MRKDLEAAALECAVMRDGQQMRDGLCADVAPLSHCLPYTSLALKRSRDM